MLFKKFKKNDCSIDDIVNFFGEQNINYLYDIYKRTFSKEDIEKEKDEREFKEYNERKFTLCSRNSVKPSFDIKKWL